MKTNDLKKGMVVQLRNGWFGVMADNMRGNTRMVKVYGDFTEIGSVYSHDIKAYWIHLNEDDLITDSKRDSDVVMIEHTPAQLKLKGQVAAFGF